MIGQFVGGRPVFAQHRNPYAQLPVEDLHAWVNVLREEGCNVPDNFNDSDFGKFVWVIDPEGHKVELWPPACQ